jgi:hypothetical protein
MALATLRLAVRIGLAIRVTLWTMRLPSMTPCHRVRSSQGVDLLGDLLQMFRVDTRCVETCMVDCHTLSNRPDPDHVGDNMSINRLAIDVHVAIASRVLPTGPLDALGHQVQLGMPRQALLQRYTVGCHVGLGLSDEAPADDSAAPVALEHAATVGLIAARSTGSVATDVIPGSVHDDFYVGAGRVADRMVARSHTARIGGVTSVDATSLASQVDIQLDGGGATALDPGVPR